MHKIFIDRAGNCIDYQIFGNGHRYIFCFPGFSESSEVFSFLSEHIVNYRVVAVNLYFIAKSKKTFPNLPLHPIEWQQTFNEFLSHLRVDRFSVLAFSLGGRFAAVTLQQFHQKMDHLIMVAPDAIQLRLTYQFATFPFGPKQLFKLLMQYPMPFFGLIRLLSYLRMINSFTTKFALKHMGNSEIRSTLYNSWIGFKPLRVNQKQLVDLLKSTSCLSFFIFGEKDKVIDPNRHKHFINQLSNTEVKILPFGHNKLVNNSIEEIKKFMTHQTSQ